MKRISIISLVVAALVAACSKSSPPPAAPEPVAEPAPPPVEAVPPVEPAPPAEPPPPPPPPAPKQASVTLAATAKSKSKVSGTLSFKEVDGGVEVTAAVEGLKRGNHAFHVHEKGDCSAPDASSAGDHFNPGGHKHGAPEADERHAGDFGNLTAGKDGKASKTFVMKGITLGDDANSIIGKALIIHDKADDFKTQPTGNAGSRLACGVIELTPAAP